jgi:hypothetical protein
MACVWISVENKQRGRQKLIPSTFDNEISFGCNPEQLSDHQFHKQKKGINNGIASVGLAFDSFFTRLGWFCNAANPAKASIVFDKKSQRLGITAEYKVGDGDIHRSTFVRPIEKWKYETYTNHPSKCPKNCVYASKSHGHDNYWSDKILDMHDGVIHAALRVLSQQLGTHNVCGIACGLYHQRWWVGLPFMKQYDKTTCFVLWVSNCIIIRYLLINQPFSFLFFTQNFCLVFRWQCLKIKVKI